MALATWPGTLPAEFELTGPVRQPKDLAVLHFKTDIGPGMTRARSAIVEEVYSVVFRFSATQYATFDTFFYSTLGNGVLPFTMANPITSTTDRFRFDPEQRPPFQPSWRTPNWMVTCHLLRRRP